MKVEGKVEEGRGERQKKNINERMGTGGKEGK